MLYHFYFQHAFFTGYFYKNAALYFGFMNQFPNCRQSINAWIMYYDHQIRYKQTNYKKTFIPHIFNLSAYGFFY